MAVQQFSFKDLWPELKCGLCEPDLKCQNNQHDCEHPRKEEEVIVWRGCLCMPRSYGKANSVTGLHHSFLVWGALVFDLEAYPCPKLHWRNSPWSLPMSQTTWGILLPVAPHDIANYMGHTTHTLKLTLHHKLCGTCTAYPMQQTSWDNTSDLCIDFPNLVKWHERWTSGGNILAQKWKQTKNTGLNIITIKTCFMQQLWKDSEWEWMNA